MKTLIITEKFSSVKDLLKYILRKKYKENIELIRCSEENYELLDEAHLINRYIENYPGAIIFNTRVAGITIRLYNNDYDY